MDLLQMAVATASLGNFYEAHWENPHPASGHAKTTRARPDLAAVMERVRHFVSRSRRQAKRI